MHVQKITKYPNNEIRCVHYYKAPARDVKELDDATSNVTSTHDCASEPEAEGETTPPSSLTLGTNSDSGDSILPFKKTRFGRNAKNTLLRIGGAYDTLSTQPSDFVFLTGTLPGNTPAAFRVIAEYSSYIAESLGHWIQRTVKSEYYFYVWELQKRGALHFHYCVYCPSVEAKQKILSTFKAKWTSLLDDISTRSEVCLWEGANGTCWLDRYGTLQAYAQTVRQSVAAYLSGYCGNDKDKHVLDENSPYYPRRWWGASRKTTTLLKSLTEEVIVYHTNYRDARTAMQRHYEDVLHDTPRAHHYPHKVGIGSTCVSYHPEDKGTSIWQGLQKQMLQHKTHPHIASLIHACSRAATLTRPHIRKLATGKMPALKPVLASLADTDFWKATQRSTLQDTHLRILKTAKSHLPTPLPCDHHLQEALRTLTLIEEFLTLNQGLLRFNQYGWLCNEIDLPYTVDFTKNVCHLSTTDADGSDAQGKAANGSLSPPNLPHQQSLF